MWEEFPYTAAFFNDSYTIMIVNDCNDDEKLYNKHISNICLIRLLLTKSLILIWKSELESVLSAKYVHKYTVLFLFPHCSQMYFSVPLDGTKIAHFHRSLQANTWQSISYFRLTSLFLTSRDPEAECGTLICIFSNGWTISKCFTNRDNYLWTTDCDNLADPFTFSLCVP